MKCTRAVPDFLHPSAAAASLSSHLAPLLARSFEAPTVAHQESTFTVLTPDECNAQAEKAVASVVELLCCEPLVAQMLLRHFRWDKDKLTEAYMSDPEGVGKKAGIGLVGAEDKSIIHRAEDTKVLVGGQARSPSTMQPTQCTICFESSVSYSALSCGHPFCNDCYAEFLSHQITDNGHERGAQRSCPRELALR